MTAVKPYFSNCFRQNYFIFPQASEIPKQRKQKSVCSVKLFVVISRAGLKIEILFSEKIFLNCILLFKDSNPSPKHHKSDKNSK